MKYKNNRYKVIHKMIDIFPANYSKEVKQIGDMLLATISKEEQSQRIMMEQVKEEVERDGWFNCTKCGIEFYCDHEITESGALCDNCFYGLIVKTHPKQDKPVERVLSNKPSTGEDTNKTSLEVPKKIKDRPGYIVGLKPLDDTYLIVDKINELINYLTLISLDKK